MTKQIKFYAIDEHGNKTLIDSNKILVEVSTGENLTIENASHEAHHDLVMRSYFSEDEFAMPKPNEKYTSTNLAIRPMACNMIGLTIESHLIEAQELLQSDKE